MKNNNDKQKLLDDILFSENYKTFKETVRKNCLEELRTRRSSSFKMYRILSLAASIIIIIGSTLFFLFFLDAKNSSFKVRSKRIENLQIVNSRNILPKIRDKIIVFSNKLNENSKQMEIGNIKLGIVKNQPDVHIAKFATATFKINYVRKINQINTISDSELLKMFDASLAVVLYRKKLVFLDLDVQSKFYRKGFRFNRY